MLLLGLEHIITLLLCCSAVFLSAGINSDTIPPSFSQVPQDLSISCQDDVLLIFTEWHMNHAEAEADNGEAEIIASRSIDQALDELSDSLNLCAGTGSFTESFFAVDTCGNISTDTLQAIFTVFDRTRPQVVVTPRNISMMCTEFTEDSLNLWILNAAYAELMDNCDPDPEWTNYIWSDSNGNNGFGDLADSTQFQIDRTSCFWSVAFTFFGRDSCGNINSTMASFTIEGDDTAPQIVSSPADLTLLCHQSMDTINPVVVDACDGFLDLELTESSTQSASTDSCGFYEFMIQRIWTASDICGNMVELNQNISVRDTLAPVLTFESIVARDCDEDLGNINSFIQFNDNCGINTSEFSDTLLTSSICITQYERNYRFTDFCGNERKATQRIQVEDFSGPDFIKSPEDKIVYCGNANQELEFRNWVNNFGQAEVQDNCNDFKVKVLNLAGLADSTLIQDAPEATLNFQECINTSGEAIVFTQQVYFYAYDVCGNVSQATAEFILQDTIPPAIPNCPADRVIFLEENDCDAFSSINLPFAIDACLKAPDLLWNITVDNDFIFDNTNQSIDFNFEIGTHTIEYILIDCAGNQSNCIQQLSVRDSFPPSLTCPEIESVFLDSIGCEAEIEVPDIDSYSDNCFGTADFSLSLPEDGGFIEFILDASDSTYSAGSFNIRFKDISNDQRFFRPVLTIDYALQIDPLSRLVLKSEFGDELFVAEKAPCVRQRKKLLIDEAQFEVWTIDNNINFAVSVEKKNGKGLIPCLPEVLDGPSGIDGFSFFTLTLEYTDVDPSTLLLDANGSVVSENEKALELPSGEYSVVYEAMDLAGNASTCKTSFSVIDTFPPMLQCEDKEFVLTPDTEEFIDIILDDLDLIASDNCEISELSYFPSEFNCQQIGREVSVVVQARDDSGNFEFCTSTLSITGSALEPDFQGSLCLADTIKLFSGVDPALDGIFSWTGPNAFKSNLRNPVITNISEINSGRYTLEFTTDKGCDFSGFVDVDVSAFLSPTIESLNTEFCEGEVVQLISNSYNEPVQYYWYEGMHPDGLLLEISDTPNIQLSPQEGTFRYYLEVEGESCRSNPSDILEIEVSELPDSELENSFLSVCPGDEIILETLEDNPEYSYNWIGPAGFNAEGSSVLVSNNAQSINAGLYSLVVSNMLCSAQPEMAQVFVNLLPEQAELVSDNFYCEGDRALIEISNHDTADRFFWFLDGELYTSSNSNTLIIPDISEDFTGPWTALVEIGGCLSDTSESLQFFIESNPIIGASNNGPVCSGDNIELTASFIPNANYTWEGPEGRLYFGREVEALAIDGSYTLSVTTSNGCSASTTTNVEVGIRPQITALSNSALDCMSETGFFSLNPTVFPPGNYIYEWSGPSGFSSNEVNPTVNQLDSSKTGIYSLRIIDEDCPSLTASTLVDFDLIPVAVEIVGPAEICEGEALVLEVLDPDPRPGMKWIWITPQGQLITNDPILERSNLNNNISGTYRVFQELNDCRSPGSNVFEVTVTEEPMAPRISAPKEVCRDASITLSVSGQGDLEFFMITPSMDTINNQSGNFIIDNFDEENAGSYRAFTKRNTCVSNLSAEFIIELLEIPDKPEFQLEELSICLDELDFVEICIENDPVDYDRFIISDHLSRVVIEQSNDNCIRLEKAQLSGLSFLQLEAQLSVDGCLSSLSDILEIEIFETQEQALEFISDSIFICDENFAIITPEIIPAGVNAGWRSRFPGVQFTDINALETSVSGLIPGANEILLDSRAGICPVFSTDTVQLILVQDIDAENDQFNIEFDENLSLDILANDFFEYPVQLSNIRSSGNLDLEFENNQIIISEDPGFGQFEFTYTICYADCEDICDEASVSFVITESEDCIAGNVITPNDDGYNDEFIIPCLELPEYARNEISIFNQWGDVVFSASPYRNNWKGSYQNEDLPEGTYFYVVKVENLENPLSGFIVLER